jgi:transposase
MAPWDQLENAFFSKDKWYQKQKMRKFCRHQKAMEDIITLICGSNNKEEQKKVVIAYGDGDKNGTLKGTAPLMSTKLFKKVSQSCCVIVVNEHKTSKLCSCCHKDMKRFQKQFRMKRCINSDCIRFVWDRDVNASINILNLFLELCYSVNEDGKGQRLEAFTRCRKKFGL